MDTIMFHICGLCKLFKCSKSVNYYNLQYDKLRVIQWENVKNLLNVL